MNFEYKPHYVVYDSGRKGPLFVAPHAGIAFRPEYQDEGTHYIAYRLAEEWGGKALISNITREKEIGVDFFRSPPTQEQALEYYSMISNGRKRNTMPFRKKYAWVARDIAEHSLKSVIFNDFWNVIKEAHTPVVFVHRQFLNPIRHPSLIDVIPFNHGRAVQQAMKKVNQKYEHIFGRLFNMYKISFDFKTRTLQFKEFLEEEGLEMFQKKRRKPKLDRRIDRFEDKTSRMPYIRLTYKKNFKGEAVKEMVHDHLLDKHFPILHLEVSEFLTNHHTELAVHLIKDLMKFQKLY
jgi:hypothetical protein